MSQLPPDVECEIDAALQALDRATALLLRYQKLQTAENATEQDRCPCEGHDVRPLPRRPAWTGGHGDPGE